MSVVAHIVSPFLFHTGGWLYGQIKSITKFHNVVFTHATENLDQFPFSPIVSHTDLQSYHRIVHEVTSRFTYRHFYWFYQPFVRKHSVNVFHAHFGPEGVFAKPLWKAFPDIPLIVSFYGVDVSTFPRKNYWRKEYGEVFQRAAFVLAEGSHMKSELEKLGAPAAKVRVQHLGVDLKRYVFRRRSRASEDESIRILHCASFREKKGHSYALRSFAKVQSTFPHTRLILIGDGPLLYEMKKLSSELSVADAVEFIGAKSHAETISEIERAHLLLYPSVTASDGDSEGGAPFGIIEALATGLPVISSRHADIPEVVQHGKSGFLAEERNVDELASYLDSLLSHPERWPEFGSAGRLHIEKQYNNDVQSESLSNIYTQALSAIRHD